MPRATKIYLTPLFFEPRTKVPPCVDGPFFKMFRFWQKMERNGGFESKMTVFCAENDQTGGAQDYFQPSWPAMHGPRYTMTSCNGPLRGPNHEWPQEDVKINPPTPWSKTIDTLQYNDKTPFSLGEPPPGAAKRPRVGASKLSATGYQKLKKKNKNWNYFQTLLGGSLGGLLGYFWVSGGQLGLKSSSIR